MNKKVVHITSVHTKYDVRIFLKECTSLSENGFDVTLISPESKEQIAHAVHHKSLPSAKSRLDRFFRVGFHALIIALKEKADIYHLHDPELIPLGFFLKLFSKRVIFDSHENITKSILDKQYLVKPVRIVISKMMTGLLRLVGCVFDAIVIVVPGMGKDFPSGKTFLVRNFPLKKDFYGQDAAPYDTEENIVLYVGGMNKIRGIVETVKSTGRIFEEKKYQDFSLYLAGKFETPDFEMSVRAMPEWAVVNYLGQLSKEKLLPIFRKAKIGILIAQPCYNAMNSYPIKLFEYMAAGLPVIISDFPIWRDIVDDAQCGLLVDPLDVNAVSDAIRYLLDHPLEAKRMGENGKRAVLNKYLWDSEAQVLIFCYETVLAKKRVLL